MSGSPALHDCRPVVLGVPGLVLDAAARRMFEEVRPVGAILFARNIDTPEQTSALCADLAGLLPEIGVDGHKLIAVDQEGGRVQRLRFGGKLPAARIYGDLYAADAATAVRAARLHGQLLAAELRAVGATWVLGPVLDLGWPQTNAIIGDRALSADPAVVARLGAAVLAGIAEGGCHGCPKHAPGHGRATADSHVELPVIQASEADLAATDWAPFRALAPSTPFLMTAHIALPAVQSQAMPATFDAALLDRLRGLWDFSGLWVSDDLSMQALPGDYLSRVHHALRRDGDAQAGGCDLVLACFSKLAQGMAGTVFDAETYEVFRAGLATVAPPGARAMSVLDGLRLPLAMPEAAVAAARTELMSLLPGA